MPINIKKAAMNMVAAAIPTMQPVVKVKNYAYRKCLFAMMLLLTTALWACQSGGPPRYDQIIAPARQIQLQDGGPHSGQADARRATVAYEYTRQPSSSPEVSLTVSGQILAAKSGIVQINIYLLALDPNGKVLFREVLYASGYRRTSNIRRPWAFDKTLTLPPETVALAFDANTRASPGRR